jgi:DNA-binding MarR family transcriptional regulator
MDIPSRRATPTSEELAVWRAHVETFEIVRARIEKRLHRDSQLSGGDYRVLLALHDADGAAVRSSELAAHIEWERSRLSGHLGRMEKRGLIRREPCPDDARGSFIFPTDAGTRAFRASTRPHFEAIKELFVDAFTPDQLAQLTEATAAMRAHLELDRGTSAAQ